MAKKGDVSSFDAYLRLEDTADQEAIGRLYGALPDWLPEPVLPQLHQALATLRNAGQSNERIATIVPLAPKDSFVIPGTALDVADFIKSVHYLAHVRWALSLDKGHALEVLGGNLAAKTYRGLRRGKEEQNASGARERQIRNARIREQAAQLRGNNGRLSLNAIALQLAPKVGLSAKQVKRILDR